MGKNFLVPYFCSCCRLVQCTDFLSFFFFLFIFPVFPCVFQFPRLCGTPSYSCPPMLSESPSLLSSSSSIISSLESSESSRENDIIDSSEHSLFDLILCTLAALMQAAPLILVPCALSLMVGSVGLSLSVGRRCLSVLLESFQTSLWRCATVPSPL